MELVVFDTNVFVADPNPDSAYWKKFREHREKYDCAVALPLVVFDELPRKLVGQIKGKASRVESKAADLVDSIAAASELGWDVDIADSAGIALPDLVAAVQSLKAKATKTDEQIVTSLLERMFGGPFALLPYPSISHRELVRRCCIEEKKPFPTNTPHSPRKAQKAQPAAPEVVRDNDRAYRDALTWFSLLERAVQFDRKQDSIIFVSKDASEFADPQQPGQFHPDLLSDMATRKISKQVLSLRTSLADFMEFAITSTKIDEEEKLLRLTLKNEFLFLEQLQWKVSELGEPLIRRLLQVSASVPNMIADISLGRVCLLAVGSVKKLASRSEFSLGFEVSVRGSILFESTGVTPHEFTMADCVTASAVYDDESKRITGITIEAHEPDMPVGALRRVTTLKAPDGSDKWTVSLEKVNGKGAQLQAQPREFDSIREVQMCLRDLDAPSEADFSNGGTRTFGGGEIPVRVLMRWGLLRVYGMWQPPDRLENY